MNIAFRILEKLLPIFLLIFLGFMLKKKKFLTDDTMDDLKKVIVSISLPAILFTAFLKLDLKISYALIFLVIFIVCVLLYLMGRLLVKMIPSSSRYLPFLMTGFEFGMMGTVFFGAVFGLENIGYIGIIALGHELFIWFVYVTLLKKRIEGKTNIQSVMRSFLHSPVIIAVCSGLLFNLLGVNLFFDTFPPTSAFLKTLEYLGSLTVPLILIIIGWNLKLDRQIIRESILPVLLRFVLVIGTAVCIDTIIFTRFLHLDRLFSAALYTFFLLPPPYILPLYIKRDETKELSVVNSFLVLYTLVSIAAFSAYTVLYMLKS